MPKNREAPKPWENVELIKVAFKVPRHTYYKAKDKFYHGQMTKLLRNVIESISDLIQQGKVLDIVSYIHKEKPLTLYPIGEKSNDIDG